MQKMNRYSNLSSCHASYVSAVHRIVHDGDPALEDGHLEQTEVGPTHVVKVHDAVLPGQVVLEARGLVGYHLGTGHVTVLVYTLQNRQKYKIKTNDKKVLKSGLRWVGR